METLRAQNSRYTRKGFRTFFLIKKYQKIKNPSKAIFAAQNRGRFLPLHAFIAGL